MHCVYMLMDDCTCLLSSYETYVAYDKTNAAVYNDAVNNGSAIMYTVVFFFVIHKVNNIVVSIWDCVVLLPAMLELCQLN